MKILKKIIFFLFLSNLADLSFASIAPSNILVEQNEQMVNASESKIDMLKVEIAKMSESEFIQKATAALKKFFIKNSKLHTVFRCGLAGICIFFNIQIVSFLKRVLFVGYHGYFGLKDKESKETINEVALVILINILTFCFMNGAFVDFFLSEINRESTNNE